NGKKGTIATGQLADLIVLSDDYFSVPEDRIKNIESVLTIVGGKIVHATSEFERLAPPPLPVTPDWSPVKYYSGSQRPKGLQVHRSGFKTDGCTWMPNTPGFWGLDCDCFVF